MKANLVWFSVAVELPASGIRGTHYVQTAGPGTACRDEEERGLIVHGVSEWGGYTGRWPQIDRIRTGGC